MEKCQIEEWKKRYLVEKGIYLDFVPELLEKKVNKIVSSLTGRRNFIVIIIQRLGFSNKLIDAICFEWVNRTGLGFTSVQNISNYCSDEDYIASLERSALLIIRYDQVAVDNQQKRAILENLLLARYNSKRATIFEVLSREWDLDKISIFKQMPILGNIIFTDNSHAKVFKVRGG